MKREQQSSVRRFFASRSFLIVALIIMTLFTLGFARAYYQDYKVKQQINQLEDEVKSLENKKIESIEILKYVTSDKYVEDKARTELNMKAEGEQVIFIQDLNEENRGEGINDEYGTEDGQTISNPVKWFYYFIHKSLPTREQ
ncbi:hypothetical protein HOF40_02845 [Candidatus Parcubacteria bacterium]|jgi:cell division protein FtsB|nr:hypothetical protein [Candidatus Parcubacteria bacterium]MBT3948999.1 hypothetical protein [Candidatus Parcubacteria bacterium]